jgi:O-antigen/teichoic acid export membrane protein
MSDERKGLGRSVFTNTAFALLDRIAVKVETVAAFILLVRLLDATDVAAIGVASGYLVVMAMLDVGPIRVLLRDYPSLARDRATRDEHLTALFSFWIVQAAAMLLACFLLERLVLSRLQLPGLGFLFFALTVDFMAISFQDWLKLVFYTDFQQTLATKISILFSAARLLSYGILLFSTSLETYSWIVIVTAVVATAIWWQIFRRRFAYRFVWHRRSLSILLGSLRSYGIWDHLNRTVKDIVFTVDTVILSWFAAVVPISDYAVALRFSNLFLMIPVQLHLGLQVALSNYQQRIDRDAAINAFLKVAAVVSLLQLIGILLFGDALIRILFGAGGGPNVTRYAKIISIGIAFMNVGLPLISVINNFGNLRRAFFRLFLPVLIAALALYTAGAASGSALGLAWSNVAVYAIFSAGLGWYVARNHPFAIEWNPLTARERSLIRRIVRIRGNSLG